MPFPQYGFALWLAASLFLLSCAPEADTTWRQVPEAEAGGWGMNVWAPTPDEVFVVGGRPERGAIMRELDGSWPAYDFKTHKGYITDVHTAALLEHGPSPVHRMRFVNVRRAAGLEE